jgi:8-oxo-dGTP diphosphatase
MGQSDQGMHTGRTRYQVIPRVLVFLRYAEDVLLLKGAPNKRIWANRFNGVGGHIEVGEGVLAAAQREVHEETGLVVDELLLTAVVNIDAGDDQLGILMFVFIGWSDRQETIASHEGGLHWVPVNQLPTGEMVEDLEWLLPRILTMDADSSPMFLHYSYDKQDQLLIQFTKPSSGTSSKMQAS